MATREELELQEQITNQLSKQVEFEKTRARLTGETLSSLEQEQALLARREQVIRQSNILIEESNQTVYEKQKKNIEEELQSELRKGEITRELYEARLKLIQDIDKARNASNEEELKAIKAQIKAQKELVKMQEKSIKAMKAGAKVAEELVDTMGGLLGVTKNTGQSFKDLFTAIKGGKAGVRGLAEGFGKAASNMFGLANMSATVFNQSLQTAVGFNKLRAELSGLTGGNRELSDSVLATADQFADQYITITQAGDAFRSLYVDFSRFSHLNPEVQQRIAGTTSLMAKLGISTQDTANNLNFLISELGLTVPEAENQLRNFAEELAPLGIVPAEASRAFANLSPRLAEFGARAPSIFKQTAREAKRLGIDISAMGGTLFALSDRLSTFQGSASAVADLSVVLGGSFVNAFDLTMAAAQGPEAQIKLLQDSLAAAGKRFKDLGFFEQRLLAQSFGQDVGKLRAIFDGAGKGALGLAKNEETLENMAKEAASAADIQAKAFESAALQVKEAADALDLAAKNFASFTNTFGGGGLIAIGAAVSALTQLASTIMLVKTISGGVGGGAPGLLARLKYRTPPPIPAGAISSSLALSASAIKAGTSTKPPPLPAAALGPAIPMAKASRFGKLAGVAKGGLGKILPGIGLALAAQQAISSFGEGDILGGVGNIAAGGLSLIPGIGTVASLGITGALAARDMGAFDSTMSSASPASAAPIATAPVMPQTSRGVTAPEVEQAMKNALASAGGTEQPIKVELYLDRSGTNKIAETTVKYIDRNYSMTGNARVPV